MLNEVGAVLCGCSGSEPKRASLARLLDGGIQHGLLEPCHKAHVFKEVIVFVFDRPVVTNALDDADGAGAVIARDLVSLGIVGALVGDAEGSFVWGDGFHQLHGESVLALCHHKAVAVLGDGVGPGEGFADVDSCGRGLGALGLVLRDTLASVRVFLGNNVSCFVCVRPSDKAKTLLPQNVDHPLGHLFANGVLPDVARLYEVLPGSVQQFAI